MYGWGEGVFIGELTMQKWNYFAMGIMAGVIAVLLTIIVMRDYGPDAHAAIPQTADNTGAGLMLATGGSQTQTTDILWVVHKRRVAARAGAKAGDVTNRSEQTSLACYQVGNGARSIKLVAVRNITFDMDLVEFNTERPSVRDIITQLKRQQAAQKGSKR